MADYKETKLFKDAVKAFAAAMAADNEAIISKPKKKSASAKKPALKKKK